MGGGTDISALYREFTDALSEVLAENVVGLTRRGRLARARAAVKKHPNYSEAGYFLAVETAFENWELIQNVGRSDRASLLDTARKPRHGNGTEDQRS
jgi:hypothetical protein